MNLGQSLSPLLDARERPRFPARGADRSNRRPVIYDLTHLISRLRARTGTGIDRIDLAFASYYFANGALGEATRYGAGGPCLLDCSSASDFTHAAQRVWTHETANRAEALWAWLEADPGAPRPRLAGPSRVSASAWRRRLLSWSGHVVGSTRRSAPERAIYINVGYHRFEEPRYFSWLASRPDVDAVFMIHDLLPLDYPEYFAAGEADRFSARIATALRHGRAFLVSTDSVRRRLLAEIAVRGLAERPIWAKSFPSPLAEFTSAAISRRPPATPYFVVVGTIEPRKNHLLLLNIWRELARRLKNPPRLVVVGARGWENEQVVDMLERCEALAPHVVEISDLSSQDLAALIFGARALLAPSFDEGYGLPIVEALSLGVPVVASDTAGAREVSQGRAALLSPLDGEGWRREIQSLVGDPDHLAGRRARARGFRATTWPDYFESLDRFLAALPPTA